MMKSIFLSSLLVAFLTGIYLSCASSPAILPTVFSCAAQETAQIITSLTTSVVDLLALPDYDAALSGLAAALGPDGIAIVNCVVQRYISQPAATTQATYDIARVHAGLWLQNHPVK